MTDNSFEWPAEEPGHPNADGSRIGRLLVEAGVIDPFQLRSAQQRQAELGGRLVTHLVELRFAAGSAIADALAKGLTLRRIRLEDLPPDPSALQLVNPTRAEKNELFPFYFGEPGRTLWIAMVDPTDLQAADEVAARAGCRVRIAVAEQNEILAAIHRHYYGRELSRPSSSAPDR